MPVRDYNGDGDWSVDGVLRPKVHTEGPILWVYPIMDAVIDGIKENDLACIELGIDFICESKSFPFGMTLKSRAARALRKATLTQHQCDRIRSRVALMLLEGYIPQEYRFYSRLLRRTGLGTHREALLAVVPRGHRMAKYVEYVHLLAVESVA